MKKPAAPGRRIRRQRGDRAERYDDDPFSIHGRKGRCRAIRNTLSDTACNLLGSPGEAGACAQYYEYTPYGERAVLNDDFTVHSDPTAGSFAFAIGHQGLLHDAESELVYNRARMLHPSLGRFAQRDPLGYVDGMSLYAYYAGMHGDLDPLGLERLKLIEEELNNPSARYYTGGYDLGFSNQATWGDHFRGAIWDEMPFRMVSDCKCEYIDYSIYDQTLCDLDTGEIFMRPAKDRRTSGSEHQDTDEYFFVLPNSIFKRFNDKAPKDVFDRVDRIKGHL